MRCTRRNCKKQKNDERGVGEGEATEGGRQGMCVHVCVNVFVCDMLEGFGCRE